MKTIIVGIGAIVLIIGILTIAFAVIQFPHIEETPAGDRYSGYPLLSFDFFYYGLILSLSGIGISIFGLKQEN